MDVKSGKANLFVQAQQATSSEAKITVEASTTGQPSQVVAEKKAPAKSKAAVHGEFQISTLATQAQLHNQLDHSSDAASHSRKKPKSNSLLNQGANAERSGQIRDNIKKQEEEIKRLQQELEQARDMAGWGDFARWIIGDDPGVTEKTSPIFTEPARHHAIKKDDDD